MNQLNFKYQLKKESLPSDQFQANNTKLIYSKFTKLMINSNLLCLIEIRHRRLSNDWLWAEQQIHISKGLHTLFKGHRH